MTEYSDVLGKKYDISIIMPCLNEEQTVGRCIDEAKAFINKANISGEIIVVDNGSNDSSAEIAGSHGASVIHEGKRGYGRAIRTGIKYSNGRVIIIGDCDMTYDFYNLNRLYEPLAMGLRDVMIGNRLNSIEKGAMRLSHRMGVRVLSGLGRMRFRVRVKDFHCGLRGMTHDATDHMKLHTDGMEFATEMIAEASRHNLKIGQTSVVLKNCSYGRESKLRTVRDGFRHLKYIILG